MNTRKEIEDWMERANPSANTYDSTPDAHIRARLLLEVLLDIRELLLRQYGPVTEPGLIEFAQGKPLPPKETTDEDHV